MESRLSFPDPDAEAAPLAAFRDRLRQAASATGLLQAWCEAHGIGEGPVRALRHSGPAEPLPAGAARWLLPAGAPQDLRHRRVTLLRGAVGLSDCDIWWLPSRLAPEMQAALDTTDRPFGAVVESLRPVRRVLAETLLPPGGPHGLEVQALLVAEPGPIALARESYRRILTG